MHLPLPIQEREALRVHSHSDIGAFACVAVDHFGALHQLAVRRRAARDYNLTLEHLVAEEIPRFCHFANDFVDDIAAANAIILFLFLGQAKLEPLANVLHLLAVAKGDIAGAQLV